MKRKMKQSTAIREELSRESIAESRLASIAKRCRLHKFIRQRFALALKIQQEDFALITSRKIQSRATVDPVANFIAIIYPVDMRRQSSRKLLFTSRCYLEIEIAKRCRLHKLIRQRFALALKIQQMLFALINQSQDTSWKHMFNTSWTTRRKQLQHPVTQEKKKQAKYRDATRRKVSSRRRSQQKMNSTVEEYISSEAVDDLQELDVNC
ncbi:hypothetical protein F511_20774 [Dorcoceras hygrometricum]|uniref:Uncharacterized protein n=1 Tax=Dorcoceras hygrometricum TaxID=472368 RepID=A0A2Z7CP32_9LAMI|nr:hypothetical protein F511_20774 [Dorcoceras hygrometricum]